MGTQLALRVLVVFSMRVPNDCPGEEMDEIKNAEHMTGHFFSPDGTRMEASYLRYPHQNGQSAYYKLPGSERKCECPAVSAA